MSSRLFTFASIFALQSVIAWLFRERIVSESPQFFAYEPKLDQAWLWIGFAVTAALSWVLPRQLDSFGSWTGWVLYLLVIVPAWPVMFSMGMEHCVPKFLLAVVGPTFMFVLLLGDKGQAFSRQRRRTALVPSSGLLFTMILIEALILWRFRDTMVWSIDVGDVYERRFAMREFASTFWSYLLSNLDHAFIPLAIAWGIASRKLAPLLVAAFGIGLLYATSGTKSSIVIPFIMIVTATARQWFAGNPSRVVLSIVVLLVGLGALRNMILDGIFVERIWCSPTLTITRYLDHFGVEERLWGRDISGFVEIFYAGERSPSASIVIGEQVLNNPQSNDNSNVFVNGYAQAGLIGAWIAAVLVAIPGRLLQRAIADDPPEVQAMVAVNFAFVLLETALHTSLLTGGLVAFIALQMILRRPWEFSMKRTHHTSEPGKRFKRSIALGGEITKIT